MNYSQTLEYMYAQLPMFTRIGAAAYKADLSVTISLNELLFNPQASFPSVHIAGTNGKGSVANMMASVLQEAGYKTALFTSPHLKDFRERIRVNGRMIPEEKVVEFVEKYRSDFETLKPSFFEMTFAMACWYFRQEKVDIAVMETGMGGRLDSTNTVHSILSIITNIGWDHMQYLGDTLPKIATEKGGIIRENTPVIIGEHQETDSVFLNIAALKHSPIIFATDNLTYEQLTTHSRSGILRASILRHGEKFLSEIEMPLAGNYQKKNLLTAVAGITALQQSDWLISHDNIYDGFRNICQNTGFQGRWQIISEIPLIIADTGHNEAGLAEVIPQLLDLEYSQLRIVLGMVSDKDAGNILKLFPKDAIYYFCRPDIPRGLEVEKLSMLASSFGLLGTSYSSVKKAFDSAVAESANDDCVFVGGSNFIVAEIV
ncbi:MAG: folylpolyglutamate synthase/dihydrofolate synthase family protein [Bacteroidales bacterium]|nr:folylpolyglutamate synthase/dihydrofolate synthase family protein [Bacteroidales bacterium]